MNFESELNSEQIMIAGRLTNDPAVRLMASELLARRDADKARAAVPMPISRKRLEFLKDYANGSPAQEVRVLVRFVLAHMDINQLLLGSEAPNETEPMQEPMQEQAQVVPHEERRLREVLLATVQNSSEVDTVRRAALALLGVEPR